MTNSKMEALNKEIASLPKNLNETFKLNNKTYQENIRDLAKMRDASGGVIGEQRAKAAAAGTSVTALGTNATLKLAEAMRNFTAVNASQSQLAESKAIKADLIKTRDDLQSKSEELSKQVKEAKTAFQQGIKNFAAGGLGLIGGVAGFQIGVEVAKGITGEENGWKRVGTVIGFSMGGQAIGSAIGLVLAQILITAGGAIGGMIATGFLALNPIVRGVAIFTAAIFAGYELFKDLPTEWKAALKEGLGVNKPVVPGTNIDKTDVGIAAGATAIGTWVAVRLGMLRPLFDATRNTIASNLAGLSMMWSVVMSSFSSFVTTLRTSLASSGPGLATSLTAGLTIAIGAIAALFSAPAVIVALKAALIASLIAGITYMGVKLKESIFGSDTKVETPNAAVQAIPTRANGGWITGPGTGTSDSIPAMLSNGEFVVNAKSAKDNWQLLTAINNGSISKFANGGSVGVAHYQSGGTASASNKPVAVVVQNPEDIAPKGAWDKFLNIVEEKYKDVQSKFSKALAPLDPLKNGTVSTNMPTFSSSDTKGLIQQMEGLKTIEKSMGLMQTKLASAGFESISIDGLTALNASTISSVASALDKIEERQKQMAKLGAGSFGAKMASEDIGRLTSEIADALKFSGTGFTKSSKFIEEKKEKKPTDITLEDQLNILNKAFPKLELSVEDFRVLPDKLRESIFGMGLQIERATTNINKEIIGKLEYGGTITQEIQDKFKKIEEDRKNYQGIVLKSIESIRTPFANMKGTFQSLGVNITEEAYNGLSDVQRELLLQLIEGAEEATKLLKQPQTAVPQDIRTAAQETVSRNIAIINETIADGAKVAMDKFGRLKFDLNKVNVSIDEFTYNMMSDLERQTLDAYRDAMIAATNKLKNEPNMPEGERQTLQKFVNDSSESLDKTFSKRRPGYKNPGQMAGDAFASSIGDGFSSAVTAAFKGQADEGKSVLETMMGSMFTTLTNTIIDTFVKGML
ncbi:hypothetical protein, partial [Flavobacterium sp.]|uniref:hypothetical protein n=1 Tax=Flavobacterium sp. TaxID=239 RepID=UPI0037BFB06F